MFWSQSLEFIVASIRVRYLDCASDIATAYQSVIMLGLLETNWSLVTRAHVFALVAITMIVVNFSCILNSNLSINLFVIILTTASESNTVIMLLPLICI
ncbi:26220_t:CDS:2 [Gigaspora margarita]|uniref:26220_t:CDS:1 n=1 Tax=Gigaspora margarita TaxID=4874 RepID=A0ABM8VYW4_GIGMA|nr:26220_t:CDS:2 [Gigaspora margarita]